MWSLRARRITTQKIQCPNNKDKLNPKATDRTDSTALDFNTWVLQSGDPAEEQVTHIDREDHAERGLHSFIT